MEAYGLVGRDAALSELRTALDDAARGRGGLMLITGEPGMGKSALLGAAARLAGQRGVGVVSAWCVPDVGAPPLWVWTQVLQALRVAGPELDRWLVERLIDAEPAVGELPALGADLRFRLFEAVAAALQGAALDRGLVVAIDDLQWADDESIALLGFLARRLAGSPVLLLATCRDTEAGQAVGSLTARADVLSLSGLDTAAIGELITRIEGVRPEQATIAAVRERTGGNPLFVRELTRLAMSAEGWGALDGEGGATVPDRIAGLLRERLERLSAPTRRVLTAAALVGRAGSTELIAEVLEQPRDAVLIAVDEAVMARVLTRGDDGNGWAFVHDLYRSVLASDLLTPQRAALHAAIGEALEARGSTGPEPLPAGALAAHFLAAGERCRTKARTYARRASAEATARFGHAEAARYLEQALRLTEETDGSARRELLLELGAARHRAGDRAGAESAYRQVAGSTEEPVALARAALGLAALEVRSGTPVDDNVAALRRAIAALEPDGVGSAAAASDDAGSDDTGSDDAGSDDAGSDDTGSDEAGSDQTLALLARLYAALARELVHADLPGDLVTRTDPTRTDPTHTDPTRAAESAAGRAVTLAERAGDRQATATALLAKHDAVWRPGGAAIRLPVITELLAAAEAADDPDLAAEGLLLRSAALIELGDPEGVAELRRFTERAEHLGHARGHWLALSRGATLATLIGDLDRVDLLAAAALEFGSEIGLPDAYGCFGTTMVGLAALGRPRAMDPPPEGDPVARYAPLLLAVCQPELDHGPAVCGMPASVFGNPRDLESRAAGALAFARWGTAEQCRDLEQQLVAYAGSQVVIGGCAAFYGPVDYYLGRLAEALSDETVARSRFRAAAEQSGRLGASGWVEQSRTALAALSELSDRAARAEWVSEGPTWRLVFAGNEVHLPDSKGLRDLATLLAATGREVHVFTLLGRDDPPAGANSVLDDEARRRYRRRIAQLRDDIERADRSGDAAASTSAAIELDAIVRELSAATGLGGRSRRLGDEVERARKTVSARIHDSLERVAAAHPPLGAHLGVSLTVGVRCAYRPNEPVEWRVVVAGDRKLASHASGSD